MSKIIKLKPPHEQITFRDGSEPITNNNITEERYKELLQRNPDYARFFDVQEIAPLEKEAKKPAKEIKE